MTISKNNAARQSSGHEADNSTMLDQGYLFPAMLEATQDGVAIMNNDYELIDCNRSFAEMLGYQKEELIGCHVWDWDATMSEEEVRTQFKDHGQANPIFTSRHRHKNGSVLDVEISVGLTQLDGKYFSVAICREITERKNAEKAVQESYDLLEQRVEKRTEQLRLEIMKREASEEELKKSRSMFKTLADTSLDVVSRFDRKYRQTYVNPAIEKFIGVTPAELLGKSLQEVPFLAPLAEFINNAIDYVFTHGVSNKIEFQLPNGLWVESLLAPEFSEDGEIVAVMSGLRDISARKKGEQELHDVNNFQTLLMELATSFINLPLSEMDQVFQNALEKIATFVKADRAFIYDYNRDSRVCRNTHEWLKPGIPARTVSSHYRDNTCEHHSVVRNFQPQQIVHIPDVELLSKSSQLYDKLNKNGVKTQLVIPMIDERGTRGCLTIESVTEPHNHSEKEFYLLRLFTQMLLNTRKRQYSEQALAHQYTFQETIAGIATDFISPTRLNFQQKVNDTLRKTGELLGVDRTALFLVRGDDTVGNNLMEWSRAGVTIDSRQLVPHPILDSSLEQQQEIWRGHQIFHFPVVAEIPPEFDNLKKALQRLEIKSSLFIPVYTDQQIYGMISFETKDNYYHWSSGQINGLRVVAQILANGLDSIQAREELLAAKNQLEERVQQRTRELEKQIKAKEEAMKELAAAQSSLLETSRIAGMAEVATNVLHNVGNVLNSINVSCTLLRDQLQHSRIAGIEKTAELLNRQKDNLPQFMATPQGAQIPGYLSTLAQILEQERQMMDSETSSLSTKVDHIKEIVSMQQSFGHIYGVQETIAPRQLLADALKINHEALLRHGVEVKQEFAQVPEVTVDRHKVLQILINLINNAKYACDESGKEDKIITLSLSLLDNDFIRFQVADNGIGIAPASLQKIFQHGFTTRKSGHGFGLHSGALAAKQLGGRLSVHSAGQGCGATFILDLPCTKEK